MTTAKPKPAAPAEQPVDQPAGEPLNRLPSTSEMAAAATSQRPSAGRIVFVPIDPALNNGHDEAPAMVVRVWADGLINVRVMPDSNKIPEWRTSVKLHDERPDEPSQNDAWWPPRVG